MCKSSLLSFGQAKIYESNGRKLYLKYEYINDIYTKAVFALI